MAARESSKSLKKAQLSEAEAEKNRRQSDKEEEMKRKLQAKYEKIYELRRHLNERKASAGKGRAKGLFTGELSNAACKSRRNSKGLFIQQLPIPDSMREMAERDPLRIEKSLTRDL